MPLVPALRPVVCALSASEAARRLARAQDELSAAERDQLDRFGSEKRRLDWFAGRLAAKAAVREWAQRNGERVSGGVEIFNDSEGVPYISAQSPLSRRLRLSLAHGSLGAIAAVHTAAVGVDAELVAPRDPATRAYFIRGDEPAGDDLAVAALWTVKEAVLKMLGLGFAGGLQNVRWGGGAEAELFGAAEQRRRELGIADFVVEQWFDEQASYCLSFAVPEAP
jgi:phosphopantetheinyl transferase